MLKLIDAYLVVESGKGQVIVWRTRRPDVVDMEHCSHGVALGVHCPQCWVHPFNQWLREVAIDRLLRAKAEPNAQAD